nr:hypothetical protein ACMD2_01380 [Ipomoea batatas]GME10159.1 hypothetical protein ACMD2_01380 [Ipomoea batatas]
MRGHEQHPVLSSTLQTTAMARGNDWTNDPARSDLLNIHTPKAVGFLSRHLPRNSITTLPLYTHPNPPSPSIADRLKFLVAVFSSASVNSLSSLFRLRHDDRLGNTEILDGDSSADDTLFWELNSEEPADFLSSGSVEVEAHDRTETQDLVAFRPPSSELENGKHLILSGPQIEREKMEFLNKISSCFLHDP